MKKGLVLEGGAMRGMFTCGVIDVFMENGIEFDGAIGVSAGACFGCNYKSKQIGRGLRYNKRFCKDSRYASYRSLFTTGDIYNSEFCYSRIPKYLDPFDTKTYRENPMEFYVVATDVHTGKALYHRSELGDERDILWMRASASMPMFSKNVKVDGYELSDGGTADSIPIQYFESIGYDRNVVVLTQPKGFVKEPNKFLPVIRKALRKTPNLVKALETRHIHYNKTTAYIREQELAGNLIVIRPSAPLGIGPVEHNPEELERVYQLGRKAAEAKLEEVKAFLKG